MTEDRREMTLATLPRSFSSLTVLYMSFFFRVRVTCPCYLWNILSSLYPSSFVETAMILALRRWKSIVKCADILHTLLSLLLYRRDVPAHGDSMLRPTLDAPFPLKRRAAVTVAMLHARMQRNSCCHNGWPPGHASPVCSSNPWSLDKATSCKGALQGLQRSTNSSS